ncbi:MAG: tetratricopeptide repeat protein [Gemmatimonadaceae bacterium]
MTVPVSPSDPAGSSLAARLARLQAVLAAAGTDAAAWLPPERRAQLKQDIIALFRDAEVALAEAQAAKDGAKRLAEPWKQLSAGGGEPTKPASASGPSRLDHLGASTYLEKGWSLISVEDAVGAEAALRRALELVPGHLEGEALLGWAQMLREQFDEARTTIEGILARDPSHALARTNLGYIALRGGHHGEAIEQLTQAIAAGTDRKATLYAHLYLGMVYREREMFDDAEQYFRKALALGPNLLQAWYELGFTFWRSGRGAEAMTAWKTGAEANKFSPWGKRCGAVVTAVEQGGEPPGDA